VKGVKKIGTRLGHWLTAETVPEIVAGTEW
jgi:hypothetical protein